MSLKDDFERNRKVFELLTASGEFAGEAEPATKKKLEPQDYTVPEAVLARPDFLTQPDDAPAKSFSLKRGASASTGMALSFEAPDSPAYPALKTVETDPASDPLETFYHRLEAESRLESQLLQEEEF